MLSKQIICLILFCFSSIPLFSQNNISVVENTELHPNGELKMHVIVKSKVSKDPSLYEYYWKKTINKYTYDTSGTMLSEMTRIELHSSYGRPCEEVLYKFIQYTSNGKKDWEYISKCDCKHEKYLDYNKGKKIVKEKKRRFTWKY